MEGAHFSLNQSPKMLPRRSMRSETADDGAATPTSCFLQPRKVKAKRRLLQLCKADSRQDQGHKMRKTTFSLSRQRRRRRRRMPMSNARTTALKHATTSVLVPFEQADKQVTDSRYSFCSFDHGITYIFILSSVSFSQQNTTLQVYWAV